MRKQLLSLCLVLVMALSFCPVAEAAAKETAYYPLNNALELMQFGDAYSHGTISIMSGLLHRNGKTEDVYVIYMHGTGNLLRKLNNPVNSFFTGLSFYTNYVTELMDFARAVIPKGSKIVIAGHSLGGMVGQQFAANLSMKSRYQILNVLGCGSPCVVSAFAMEGSLHRLADSSDIVPFTTPIPVVNFVYGLSIENTGTGLDLIEAHQSYFTASVWAKYDCFGVKGGNATLEIDPYSIQSRS